MITWSMVPKFVIRIHPITFVVKIFKSYDPIIEFPCTITEHLRALAATDEIPANI